VGVGITNPLHLAFIAVIALIFLGPKRLPDLARTLGGGLREFREAISGENAHEPPEPDTSVDALAPAAAPATATAAATTPAAAGYVAPTPAEQELAAPLSAPAPAEQELAAPAPAEQELAPQPPTAA
jgi:sec-independent protein translocase protein TatA